MIVRPLGGAGKLGGRHSAGCAASVAALNSRSSRALGSFTSPLLCGELALACELNHDIVALVQRVQILGIDRTTLYAKIKKYGLGRP